MVPGYPGSGAGIFTGDNSRWTAHVRDMMPVTVGRAKTRLPRPPDVGVTWATDMTARRRYLLTPPVQPPNMLARPYLRGLMFPLPGSPR